jgi:hypothetical protein
VVGSVDEEAGASDSVIARITNPVVAWCHRHRRSEHIGELRRLYHVILDEAPPILEGRVEFHLAHLDDYWSRCLGFLEVARPAGASFLAGDWFLGILVASEVASGDIHTLCGESEASALGDTWEAYVASLVRARRGVPSVERSLHVANERYARVKAAYVARSAAENVD